MKGKLDTVDPSSPSEGHIRLRFWRDDRAVEVEMVKGESMIDLLRRIGVRIDGALVMRGGTPIPLDDPVLENDVLTIIDVQSGG